MSPSQSSEYVELHDSVRMAQIYGNCAAYSNCIDRVKPACHAVPKRCEENAVKRIVLQEANTVCFIHLDKECGEEEKKSRRHG